MKYGNPRRGYVNMQRTEQDNWIPGWLITVSWSDALFIPDEDPSWWNPESYGMVWVYSEPRKAKDAVHTIAEWTCRVNAKAILHALEAAV